MRNPSATDSLKSLFYHRAVAEARGFGLDVVEKHSSADKPWGGYLRIAEGSLPAFRDAYWNGVDLPALAAGVHLDPKILIVAPRARLSLQSHKRRSEHWRVLEGPVDVVIGADKDSIEQRTLEPGEVIRIPQGYCHRLIGRDNWGRVAELWEHTDPAHPSDEDDIERLQDDYGR